jgi:hypothetical protein
MNESDFFQSLEARVTRELAGMRQKELTSLWCDGFIPDDFIVVGKCCNISGRVWIGVGSERQECWSFVLHLGGDTLIREEIDWPKFLPDPNVTGWLSMDSKTKFMKIRPTVAYPDLEPSSE